jgi:ribose transport system permease protein
VRQLLLPTIAAAVFGAIGNIGLTVVGTLIVSIVRKGITFLGVDIFAQSIIFGVALILAVFVPIDRRKNAIIK